MKGLILCLALGLGLAAHGRSINHHGDLGFNRIPVVCNGVPMKVWSKIYIKGALYVGAVTEYPPGHAYHTDYIRCDQSVSSVTDEQENGFLKAELLSDDGESLEPIQIGIAGASAQQGYVCKYTRYGNSAIVVVATSPAVDDLTQIYAWEACAPDVRYNCKQTCQQAEIQQDKNGRWIRVR